MQEKIKQKTLELAETLKSLGLMVATAESCTGGLIAAAFTEIPGSSEWFDRGFVTYNNVAKHELIKVSDHVLECYGAVSAACAAAMVKGTLENSHAQIAVSVTGIAGPTGEEPGKPVGTVFIGWGRKDEMPSVTHFTFEGDRQEVRMQAVYEAISGLVNLLKG